MKIWNKETRNEEGNYYRSGDWGIEKDDDFTKDNFTEIAPDDYCLLQNCPVDWNEETQSWDLDLTKLRELLKFQIDTECYCQIAEQVYDYSRNQEELKTYISTKQINYTDELAFLKSKTSTTQDELDRVTEIEGKLTLRFALIGICNKQTDLLETMEQDELIKYNVNDIKWVVE